MNRFRTTIRRDVGLDLTTLEVRGELSAESAPGLQAALTACVTECPSTVIVDLSRCDIDSPQVLSAALSAATAPHDEIPPVNVTICGDAEHTAGAQVPTFGDYAQARSAAANDRERHLSARLDFDRSESAPARIRELIRGLCRRWSTPAVCADAELVASELVTNAVIHGGTGGVVEVAVRDGFLHIRVEDGSPVPPGAGVMPAGSTAEAAALPHGRGLALVRLLSSAWGFLVDEHGTRKVVWAAMRWQALPA